MRQDVQQFGYGRVVARSFAGVGVEQLARVVYYKIAACLSNMHCILRHGARAHKGANTPQNCLWTDEISQFGIAQAIAKICLATNVRCLRKRQVMSVSPFARRVRWEEGDEQYFAARSFYLSVV